MEKNSNSNDNQEKNSFNSKELLDEKKKSSVIEEEKDNESFISKSIVSNSKEIINSSDLVIFMLNNNDKITTEELELLDKIKNKPSIVVINKIDLDKNLTLPNIDKKIIEISVKDNIGIDTIKEEIKSIYNLEQIETTDMTYLSNARSISLLKQSLSKINDSINNIKNESPIDMVELDLKNAWELLGEIIGETYTDELIDELFSRFCLGK